MNLDKNKILNAIEEFNKFFHANCKLISIDKDEIKILFQGHICFTCGAYDYFEDLASFISEKLNKEYKVKEYYQTEENKYIVIFAPKEKVKGTKRDIKVYFYI